ncbi:flagellar basal body rod protein FlgF [Dongshaea marina]|uniref:flagellar basal body rod protein FlgF n=1 Tax=Dongshaea marina TaxID=2047966 RepID=UPI000D3E6653|nr:flagellar basal body rod protein FlgF [Dongshaea marina]
MDRLLYVSMTGAKENMVSMAKRANNLANASTIGFKSDFQQARAMQAFGEGLPTRVFSMTERAATNYDQGSYITTGRELDVAVKGEGWLVVKDSKGEEAFTRMGNLSISVTGELQTSTGLTLVDVGGNPIILPQMDKIVINKDGTIHGLLAGATPDIPEDFQQLKLVNPQIQDLYKGNDGLFRRKDGEAEAVSADVRLANGKLESSNVNVVAEMTHLIQLQRQFETQVKMMKTAEENDQAQERLLRMR